MMHIWIEYETCGGKYKLKALGFYAGLLFISRTSPI